MVAATVYVIVAIVKDKLTAAADTNMGSSGPL